MAFDFKQYFDALTSAIYFEGAILAIFLATSATFLASVGGLALALMRASNLRIVQALSAGYVWIFRALPLLLVLIAVWNATPQLIPAFRGSWFNPFLAALIALSLTESAIVCEIFRGAFLAVDEGQVEAARVLGLSPTKTLLRIQLPQVIRTAIPPMSTQYILMIKLTSLASVISLHELLAAAQNDVSRTFKYAEYYGAASTYYLVIVSVLMIMQQRLERRYVWKSRAGQPTPKSS